MLCCEKFVQNILLALSLNSLQMHNGSFPVVVYVRRLLWPDIGQYKRNNIERIEIELHIDC